MPPRLFLDASVLIAAAGSSEGGSALVLALCAQGQARALLTQVVLREAERNIRSKMGDEALLRYYNLLGDLDPVLIPIPARQSLATAHESVAGKDAHVLAGARDGGATHLLTLDRKHLLTDEVRQAAQPIVVCTPGEYLGAWLDGQPD